MYKEAFWVLFFITVITLYLEANGYALIETVMFLIVMDFIALWIYLESRKSSSAINEGFVHKIESLESACSKISESIGAISSVLNLEDRINREKEDVNSMLQRINEKNLVLEEKINSFGQKLMSSAGEEGEEVETY